MVSRAGTAIANPCAMAKTTIVRVSVAISAISAVVLASGCFVEEPTSPPPRHTVVQTTPSQTVVQPAPVQTTTVTTTTQAPAAAQPAPATVIVR